MNPGIFTSGYEPPPMPRDLLGAPTPVPTVATRIFNPDNLVLVLDTNREVSNNVTLHIQSDAATDLTIDWGDGTTSRQVGSGAPTKTYSQKGVYVVQVSGRLNWFGSNLTATKPKVVECLSFGNLGLTSLSSGLRSYANLTRAPSRLPPKVTSLGSMFLFSGSFNYPIGSWNTSAVTSMSAMFQSATSFNQPIGQWDTSAVTSMSNMFLNANSFNQPIHTWNISSVTTMSNMFNGSTWGQANYNAALIAWSQQPVKNNVTWGVGTNQYSAGDAAAARAVLVSKGWIITDGGQAP